jgi:hypothetical protein
MSNNAELYSSGGHLSTTYRHKFFTKPLFGTLNGKRRFPLPLPGKMHKRKNPLRLVSREMIAIPAFIGYTMAILWISGGRQCI